MKGTNNRVNIKVKRVGIILAAMTILSLVGCGTEIEQTRDTMTAELGDAFKVDLNSIFKSDNRSKKEIANFEIDCSAVNINELGDYEMKISNEKEVYTVKVKVVDTIAPEIEVKEKIPAVYAGDIIKASDFVNVYDHGNYIVCFENEGNQSEEMKITSDMGGLADIKIVVTDESGNSSSITIVLPIIC